MDLLIEQLIAYAVISAVIIAVFLLQTKHKDKIMLFRNLIEKMLIANAFSSLSILLADTAHKPSKLTNTFLKNKRWNQTELGYFDLYLDRAYGKGKIVSIGKEVYYRIMVLFIQRI